MRAPAAIPRLAWDKANVSGKNVADASEVRCHAPSLRHLPACVLMGWEDGAVRARRMVALAGKGELPERLDAKTSCGPHLLPCARYDIGKRALYQIVIISYLRQLSPTPHPRLMR
jgi:hypothetical protein